MFHDSKLEVAQQAIHRLSDAELRQELDSIRQVLRQGSPQLEDFEKVLLYKDELQKRLWLEEDKLAS